MEIIQNCYCCGNTNFRFLLEAKDAHSEEHFSIVQCNQCNFVFTNPRPTLNEIGKYYTSADYVSHKSHSKGLLQQIYRIARSSMLRKKLQLIRQIIQKENNFSLLDFGCGTGDFLGFVQQQNIKVVGVEPEAHAREVAKSINNIHAYSLEEANNLKEASFDVITLWHVMEHIHALHPQIDLFNKWLKPNGKLIVAVPNIESHDAAFYGKYWGALDVPRHIYHFSPSCIQQLVAQHALTLIATHPLYLDAYFISLISEWNKGTNKLLAYVKAVWRGFMSNFHAKKDGNYSSLIYVFEKKA